MALSIVKETVELDEISTDDEGNAFILRRINLKENMMHRLLQVDMFEDVYFKSLGSASEAPSVEIVITTYPSVPTTMNFKSNVPVFTRRYTSAGDDSILFKAIGEVKENEPTRFTQFPSETIAADNNTSFYSDHLFINIHFMGIPNLTYDAVALSFLFVLDDKKVPQLTHSLGVLAESHNAMCAEQMSTGYATSVTKLQGSTFPFWKYGGIRPELMLPTSQLSAGFFLDLPTRDEERMNVLSNVRQAVDRSRTMVPFDAAYGEQVTSTASYPEWLRFGLVASLAIGPIRSDPVPLKYADNGNTLMF